MPIKKALAFSAVINLFFLILCLIFGDLKFGAIDDYFMAARLTGAFGTEYNPHLIFVNAIYGYALLPLYHLFPKIGWYYIGEMTAVFISFFTIGYVLLRKMGANWGTLLATLFTALFASDFYLVVQFTQCASILSAAGMLLFAYEICEVSKEENASKFTKAFPFTIALFLMLWGSMMRWQAFLMGMPFFCLNLLFMLKECWNAKWLTITCLAILFASAFSMHAFDRHIYEAPEYKEFNEFQGPRVAFGDKNNYNQNAVYEDLEERGLSGKDYHMLTTWTFYDTEAFSADSLRPYSATIQPYKDQIQHSQIPRNLVSALSHSLRAPLFWTWFIFCLVLYFTNRSKFIYLVASLTLILSLIAYLQFAGRLVYRVENGFWLYAAVLAIPLARDLKFKLSPKITVIALTCIAIINVYLYATEGEMVRDPNSGNLRTLAVDDSTNYSQVFEFMNKNSDKMFLLSMKSFMRFSHHKNPPYLAEPIGSYRNAVSFGYWTPYLPEVKEALKDYGIVNPIKDVVKENVIVLDNSTLSDYLQHHYYDSVAVDTLKTFGEMTFSKYRLVSNVASTQH